MLEIVLLQDTPATYASNWLRLATTAGTDTIKLGDVFRERGFGDGSEELLVAAVDISPIPGGSRILFTRCHHSTQPRSYRMGAVLLRVEELMPLDPDVRSVSGQVTAGAPASPTSAPKPRRQREAVTAAVPDLLSDV